MIKPALKLQTCINAETERGTVSYGVPRVSATMTRLGITFRKSKTQRRGVARPALSKQSFVIRPLAHFGLYTCRRALPAGYTVA
ncbi:hypothetical protein EVAR_80027_1 [Eumeta japonica]|uniref:Uncharacterized protein n=1 Tax=Eumeta variegata TaxID=151549 RepID=A0A4C1WN50_EUMVA|nr:hypothetical protein EVAR_80027_1 [Eumeta japonica]